MFKSAYDFLPAPTYSVESSSSSVTSSWLDRVIADARLFETAATETDFFRFGGHVERPDASPPAAPEAAIIAAKFAAAAAAPSPTPSPAAATAPAANNTPSAAAGAAGHVMPPRSEPPAPAGISGHFTFGLPGDGGKAAPSPVAGLGSGLWLCNSCCALFHHIRK